METDTAVAADGELVDVIEKNATEQIRVRLREYRGYDLLDLRIFYQDGEEWKPTRKGLTLRYDRVSDLLEALEKAEQAIAAHDDP